MSRYTDRLFAPLARRDGIGGRWVNPTTGQGGLLDRHTRTMWVPPLELPRQTIDGILQFEGLGRRIVWREPYDCTREGFELVTDNVEQSKRIASYAMNLGEVDGQQVGALQIVGRARAWARAYGGGMIVPLIDDGRDPREPLDAAMVRSIRGWRVLDRHEASVATWVDDMRSSELGRPEYWNLTIGASTRFVHHTRVIQVQGNPLPARVIYQRNGWGGSMLDLVWASFRNWKSSLEYLPEFVSLLTQGVFKQKGLADKILAGQGAQIAERYARLREAMGVLRDMAIDMDEEGYEIQSRPSSGVAEIFDKLVEAFVADGDMPRSIVLGETVGGLNTGENAGETRAWYDVCGSTQIHDYEPPMLRMLKLVCAAKDGPTGGLVPPMSLKWRPLWQPTRAEDDAHDISQAQRRQIDVTSAVVSATEARQDPALKRLYPGFDPDADAGVDPTAPEDDPEGILDPIMTEPVSSIPQGESLMSGNDAASRLGVRASSIRRMAANRQIRAWRINGRLRYLWSEIESAITTPVH